MMWNKVRAAGASSGNSLFRKILTTAVAFGLAASFTLGAAPVSATQPVSYADWALNASNLTPQWGDEVVFTAEINWSSCKRIPMVYLLGTADNGDPISEKLTALQISGKTYSYTVTYGGVDVSGVPYDSELTQAERATLHDRRLPSGWNSFNLMATSTQLNCGFKKIYTDTSVDFFVGPKLDAITLTTNATHELSVDTTAGLVALADGEGYDFTAGIYDYEATSQLGDASSELWLEDGEMVGDTLTVDVNERDDWDGNPSGVNCYLDSEVVTTGVTVADGHHAVDDAEAVDCASIPVDELGEHTLTIERWIDSCNDGCLSWTTYTISFARVENRDAVPYSLDLVDASTGATLPDNTFNWSDPSTTNNIDLAPDFTNGIEIQSVVPFGADLSCEYDEDGIALAPGDVFQPTRSPGDTYLVCTVTPEDSSAASFNYTVTIHRISSNVAIDSINVYRDGGDALRVTHDPAGYTSEVDYSAGMALYTDETVSIEVVPQDLETDVTCYHNAGLTHEDDCANFDLKTPYDSTTGAWILLTAENGSEQAYHLVIEHTTVDSNSGLADATNGLQFGDSYVGDGVDSAWSVGDCLDLSHGFDGDATRDWCVRQYDTEGSAWVPYVTDDSTGTIYTTMASVTSQSKCQSNRYPASPTHTNCNGQHLASRTDNNDSAVTNGDNNFEVTVTAQDETTTVYHLYIERIDDNSKLDSLSVLNDSSSGVEFDAPFSATDYEYHVTVNQDDLTGDASKSSSEGIDVVTALIDSSGQHFRSNPNMCLVGFTEGVLVGDADCSNILIPSNADDDFVVVVRVFAQNGTHSDYTIYFTFNAVSDRLSELFVNGDLVDDNVDSTTGTAFDEGSPGNDWYFTTNSSTATVTYSFITPTEDDLSVQCFVDSVSVGCSNISLVAGATKDVQVKVLKAPGAVRHIYTVHVYRRSDVKTLSDLAASGDRPLTPGFGSLTYNYTARLGSETFRVDYTTGSILATATCVAVYDGEDHSCRHIPTDLGIVVVTVTVTAENGDQQEYEIRFTNGPAPQYVTKAKVSGTMKVGSKLTALSGVWRYQPSWTYLWYSCSSTSTSSTVTYSVPTGCSSTGQTGRTFSLGSGQRGSKMMVRITGTNSNGSRVIYTALTLVIK